MAQLYQISPMFVRWIVMEQEFVLGVRDIEAEISWLRSWELLRSAVLQSKMTWLNCFNFQVSYERYAGTIEKLTVLLEILLVCLKILFRDHVN